VNKRARSEKKLKSTNTMNEKSYSIIYIAGPMSGLPKNNYPAFFAAEADLVERFPMAEVINPARNFGKGARGLTHADYMRRCAPQVFLATHFYVLKGWQHSVGARWEVATAEMLKLPIVYEKTISSLVDMLIQAIAAQYQISEAFMMSETRKAVPCQARQVLAYWLMERIGKNSVDTAKLCGYKDHATALHARNKIKNFIGIDREFQTLWAQLEPILLQVSKIEGVNMEEETAA
jgi:hypothetical protein